MKNFKEYIFILMLLNYCCSFGQSQFDMIGTNKSPEASSGGASTSNVDMFNGKMNTNIPLHIFKGREFDLPISISYHADGVQVNEIASNVGLGWILNLGGRINRIVNVLPDDYLNQPLTPLDCNPYKDLSPGWINLDKDYYQTNAIGLNDIFSNNSEYLPYFKSRKDPKIKIDGNEMSGDEFTITDPDGNMYFFGQNNVNEKITSISGVPSECGNYSNTSKTSFLLTKIISKNRLDEYIFTYQNFEWLEPITNYGEGKIFDNVPYIYNSNYKLNQQMITEVKYNGEKIIGLIYNPRQDLKFVGGVSVGNALYEINFFNFKSTSSSYKKINFNYTYFGNNSPTSTNLQKRLKLDSVIFSGIDINNTAYANERYEFEYDNPQNVPAITNLGRDFLDLYNGQDNNTNLITTDLYSEISGDFNIISPGIARKYNFEKSLYGILKKIIYPSKGFTEFEYEQNAVNGDYRLNGVTIPAYDTFESYVKPIANNFITDCTYYNAIDNRTVNEQYMRYLNFSNFQNNSAYVQGYIPRVNTVLFKLDLQTPIIVNGAGRGIYLLQKIDNCNLTLDNLDNCFSTDYILYNPCMIKSNDLYFDGLNSSQNNNYVARGLTWNLNDTPITLNAGYYQLTCWSYENTALNGGNNDNASVYIRTEGSNIIHHPAVIIPNTALIDTKFDLTDGFRIKSLTDYSEINKIVNKKSYKYSYGYKTDKLENYYKENYGASSANFKFTRLSRGYFNKQIVNYTNVIEEDNKGIIRYEFNGLRKPCCSFNENDPIEQFNASESFYTNHSFRHFNKVRWNLNKSNRLLKKIIMDKNFNEIATENFEYIDGEIIINDMNGVFDTKFYYLQSDCSKINRITSCSGFEYHINDNLSPILNGTSSTFLRGSGNDANINEYEYDFFQNVTVPNTGHEYRVTGVNNNISGYTKYIYTPFTNTTVTPNITRYLLSEVQNQPINGGTLDPKTRYNYDLDGNMIEMVNVTPVVSGATIPNNHYESYIYGYNNRFVVAKITGAKYSDIPTANITAIKTASNQIINDANNTAMETALNALRSVTALANAQITTTTINPVFGPTSVTDPKGYTIYNEYDVFGRPTLTKEKNPSGGFNILSETKYNTRAN